ncbi:hypothetical protein BJ875DRAFT_282776 [Amylocarpus encephaloides]|uniref:PAR32 protein n=1 Tax=Amylocarpus encephaloides TaxID=45428 RepID=A0A9P7YKX5_9HELO|nr:hypothetical protein BJ875DRAFT_282776 [Amylocarpus encephaloides]
MAAVPQHLSETGRRSSSENRQAMSHGRGGAGNIGKSTPADLAPVDLQTPTIKSDVYTTGRGGSGNMAKNIDPEAARRAQDVIGVTRRESGSQTHVGRGGAANIFKPSAEEISKAKKDAKWESPIGDDDNEKSKGLAEKGKEWLFGKK